MANGPITISERFADQCSPVISSNYDTCGTVSRATINHLDLDQLEDLFAPDGLFADLDAWFMHSLEMKACGVKRFALYDWIMANADRETYRAALGKTPVAKSKSLLHPFILGMTESVVNRDHWKITAGYSTGAYTASNGTDGNASFPLSDAQLALATTPVGLNKRIIRVTSRHGIPMDVNWFRQRESIHIFSRTAGGATRHSQWVVVAAASAPDLEFTDLVIADINGGSDELYDATPTAGVLIPGVNNVNDYEKWCQNLPTLNPRKEVPFWVQTFRTGRCTDSEYRKVFLRLMESNPAFRLFGDLDEAQRNKQDEMEMQRRFVNEFIYNKPLPNQTLATWQDLEAISSVAGDVLDPGVGGKLMARRANFVGVREQLLECGRVFDLANQPLNLIEFLNLNYDIMRARKTMGRKVTDIDWWTDSIFRARFQTAAFSYYKDQYLDQLRMNVQINQLNDSLGIVYDSYYFKRPGGVRINILSDEYFDDFRGELADSDIESVGSVLWALDIGKPGAGSIYWAQIEANRKVYTTAQIEQLARLDSTYRCVMAVPSIEQSLLSQTGTVIVECPLASAQIFGIADEDPITTGVSGAYSETDLY